MKDLGAGLGYSFDLGLVFRHPRPQLHIQDAVSAGSPSRPAKVKRYFVLKKLLPLLLLL